MAGKSDAFENVVLALATGQAVSLTGISGTVTPYLAVFTGTLTGDTPGTEASGGGYARVSTLGKWAAPSNGSVSNNALVTLPTATGVWSSGAALTHFGLFDAATGGTALYYGVLSDQTKTVGNNDVIQFPSSSLTLTED